MTVLISSARPIATKRALPMGFGTLRMALSVWAERRMLSKMDAARLIDMGISPAEAAKEAARSFWDFPDRHPC